MDASALNAISSAQGSASVANAQRAAASLAMAGNAKAINRLPADQQVKAAAGQFEAILLRQFLQQSVSGLMGGENSGSGGNVYGYMLTDVLASKLSEGGGLGLANILQKQLTPRGLNAAAAEAKGTP